MEEEIKQDQEQEEKETLTKGLDAHKDLAQSLSWVSLYQFKSSAPFHWITVEDKIKKIISLHMNYAGWGGVRNVVAFFFIVALVFVF